MRNVPFDFFGRCTEADQSIAAQFIGSLYRPPDLVISPNGHGEYLFRWWVTPHSDNANVYFHVQTKSDPERPLHDHPWDSTSVILAGGYDEIINEFPMVNRIHERMETRKPGDVIFRPGTWAHRLVLPADVPYSMSLFSTGPKVRNWGFWFEDGWKSFEEVTATYDGQSHWKE
jgi:hypothetical protein